MESLLHSSFNNIEKLLIEKVREAIGIDGLMARLAVLPDKTFISYKEFFGNKRSLKVKVEFVLWLNTLSDEDLKSFNSSKDSFRQFQIDKRNGANFNL